MPSIKLHTSVSVSEEKREAFLSTMSNILAEKIGKPEQYVMVAIEEGPMLMSGESGPAAFADIRSIGGLNGDVNRAISASLCELFKEYLDIAQDRVYINFTDVPAVNWGWDGRTFG